MPREDPHVANHTTFIIGADIGSVEIMLARADASPPVTTIGNEKKAIDRWLKTLPPGSMIGMEATGCYHQCLADRAAALGFTVYVLNPKDVAYYAKALGQRGKTDRLDARQRRPHPRLAAVLRQPPCQRPFQDRRPLRTGPKDRPRGLRCLELQHPLQPSTARKKG